jgi:hypothetical protein
MQATGGISWYLAALLPPSAMTLFAMTLVAWEVGGQGISWETVFMSVADDIHFSAASVIAMLLLDTLVFWALTLALDRFTRGSDSLPAALKHSLQWLSQRFAESGRVVRACPLRSEVSSLSKPMCKCSNMITSSRTASVKSSYNDAVRLRMCFTSSSAIFTS